MDNKTGSKRLTLREQCTEEIRGRIITGVLSPGEHIVETRLCEELEVSRGTLRESLRPLEAEELVVSDGRGHLLVRKLSPAEVLEVFEVRAIHEILAATKLAERPDRDAIAAELRSVLAPLQEEGLSFAEQIEIDVAFHSRLCELTNHETLIASWRRLVGQIQMVIIAAGEDRASDRMGYDEHDRLVAAIESGDVERVETEFKAHMSMFAEKYVGDAMAQEMRRP